MVDLVRFYLHGLPGSQAELDFTLPGWKQQQDFLVLDRLALSDDHDSALEAMAAQISSFKSVHLIGFSLGAMSALKLAAKMPETVAKIDLIAPAAPLELGDYLDEMAGKPIFEAARDGARLGILSAAQGVMASVAPGLVIKAMFSNAAPSDKALLDNQGMQIMLRDGLTHCLSHHQAAYKSELRAFVSPWLDTLKEVKCPVRVWHGSSDNWAPIGLSHALVKEIGYNATLTELENLSHYSALKAVLPKIVRGADQN